MALGFIDIPFLSITLLVADEVVKAAGVKLIGIESTGNPSLLVRLEGDVAAVQAALERAETFAASLGAKIVASCLSRPEAGFKPLVHFPNAQNPLYGGRDQFLPTDFPATSQNIMNKKEALGIIETQG
jgi:microcompartment protein CcmL/EutN